MTCIEKRYYKQPLMKNNPFTVGPRVNGLQFSLTESLNIVHDIYFRHGILYCNFPGRWGRALKKLKR